MIEGKPGHHFQVDEMRHIVRPACPAFTVYSVLKDLHSPGTTRPTRSVPTIYKSMFGIVLLSVSTMRSAHLVYAAYKGCTEEPAFV